MNHAYESSEFSPPQLQHDSRWSVPSSQDTGDTTILIGAGAHDRRAATSRDQTAAWRGRDLRTSVQVRSTPVPPPSDEFHAPTTEDDAFFREIASKVHSTSSMEWYPKPRATRSGATQGQVNPGARREQKALWGFVGGLVAVFGLACALSLLAYIPNDVDVHPEAMKVSATAMTPVATAVVTTEPAGLEVFDVESGKSLGLSPLELQGDVGSSRLVRVKIDGRSSAPREVHFHKTKPLQKLSFESWVKAMGKAKAE